MVESVVLSDRSRAILRCIVEACGEAHRPSAPAGTVPAGAVPAAAPSAGAGASSGGGTRPSGSVASSDHGRPADVAIPADAVRVPDEDGTGSAAWPCDVAPPTRRELTPLRMQGLVSVRADEDGHLLASPTPLGLEVAGRTVPDDGAGVDDAAISRRIVERVARLVEAEPDAETRLRLRAAWSVLHTTVERAADDVVPQRRGPRALAVRARALRRRPAGDRRLG